MYVCIIIYMYTHTTYMYVCIIIYMYTHTHTHQHLIVNACHVTAGQYCPAARLRQWQKRGGGGGMQARCARRALVCRQVRPARHAGRANLQGSRLGGV